MSGRAPGPVDDVGGGVEQLEDALGPGDALLDGRVGLG